MDKFSTALRGYDKSEVNTFIDDIINRVESMISEIEVKDEKINKFKKLTRKHKSVIKKLSVQIAEQNEEIEILRQKLEAYDTTGEAPTFEFEHTKVEAKQIIDEANEKARKIVEEAEDNADIIINECLMNAKKSEMELNNLKRDIETLKQKKETLYYGD